MENKPSSNPPAPKLVAKIYRRRSIPVRYREVFNLGTSVDRAWTNNNPNFVCPYINQADIQRETVALGQLLDITEQKKSDKRENTVGLAQANKAINKAASALRNHIKSEFVAAADLEPYYLAYGFVKNDKGRFEFPLDGEARKNSLTQLLQTMSLPNDKIAGKVFGLSHWQDLNIAFATGYTDSERIRSGRSVEVKAAKTQYEKLRKLLLKLHGLLAFIYEDEDINAVRRSFGFLRESF